MRHLFFAAIALFAVATAGCEIHIAEQDIQFRHDPGSDSLDILIVYQGVTTSNEKPDTLKEAVKTSRQFLEGRRRFVLLGWPFSADIDAAVESLSEDPLDIKVSDELKPRAVKLVPPLREALERWRLREHGAFLDDGGRLSVYQIFRLEKLSKLIECVNEFISLGILNSMEKGEFKLEGLDDHDRSLWRNRAESGAPWFYFLHSDLVVDLPLTQASYKRLQGEVLAALRRVTVDAFVKDMTDDDSPQLALFLAQVAAHLRGLEVRQDRVLLRFGPGQDGIFRLHPIVEGHKPESRTYDTRLLDELQKQGIQPDPDVKLDRVLMKLSGPTESEKGS